MGAGLPPAEQQKAGVGFGGDQPSAMLALFPKGEYKGITLRYLTVSTAEKK